MDKARSFLPPRDVDVVIHHSPCDDGHAAAASFFMNGINVTAVGSHPANDLTQDMIDVCTGKNVVMVDMMFNSAEHMTELARCCKRLLVLDHHESSKDVHVQSSEQNIHVLLDMTRSGVMLAWAYICNGETPLPPGMEFIGLKDLWQHEDNPYATAYMTAFERPKRWEDWAPYLTLESCGHVMDKGRVVLEYKKSAISTMAEKARYMDWKGYRIALINVSYPWISDMGAFLCQTQSDRTIAVMWSKVAGEEKYNVSFRSHNRHGPDTRICGSRGHIHASGMRTEHAPWEMFGDTAGWTMAEEDKKKNVHWMSIPKVKQVFVLLESTQDSEKL